MMTGDDRCPAQHEADTSWSSETEMAVDEAFAALLTSGGMDRRVVIWLWRPPLRVQAKPGDSHFRSKGQGTSVGRLVYSRVLSEAGAEWYLDGELQSREGEDR